MMANGAARSMLATRVHMANAPLARASLTVPEPGPRQVLLKVRTYGVCRTDPHIADGELAVGKRPVTPGHEIVSAVVTMGVASERLGEGERAGVTWLGATCRHCVYCASGRVSRATPSTVATRSTHSPTSAIDVRSCRVRATPRALLPPI